MSDTRPGVEITQEIGESAATVIAPTLVPVVIGICLQIIGATESDGSLSSDALYPDTRYNQGSMLIPQANFPDPRGNIDELEIDEAEVRAHLYFGGVLTTLLRGSNGTYGTAFLKQTNFSKRAALLSSKHTSIAFDGTTGDAFTFALDVANPVDTSKDVTVTLLGTLTIAEIVEEINDAVGKDVAEVFNDADDDFGNGAVNYLLIKSATFGAVSSITVRKGTSALPLLFGASFDDGVEYRVEGSGFRGQDDEDSDLTTPWIEFYRGEYSEDGTDTTFPALGTANALWGVLVDHAGDFVAAKSGAVTFTGTSATVPLQAATSTVPGDQFWADGVQVGNGEIIKVEERRFKTGKLSTTLSTFNDDGEATNRVYDTKEVSTENHGVPFAPKYAYFVADGLEFGNVTPVGEAATLTGSNTGLAERSAYVMSSSAISFPLSIASLTFTFQVTEDGVAGSEVTHTFVGGPYVDIAALVAAIDGETAFDQFTVGNSGDQLILQTTKTGADQSISIKSTGTANTALGFSASVATKDDGKDHEFATEATLTSDTIALPMDDLSSLAFDLTIVDSKGTHALSATGVDLSAATDLGDVADALAEAFGGTASTDLTFYDGAGGAGAGGIPVATITTSGAADTHGTITLTTTEGGSTVTLELTAVDDGDGWRFLGFYDGTEGKYAEVDSDGGVSSFVDLAGSWVVGATTGFDFDVSGGANDTGGNQTLTLAAATYDADEMAAQIQVQIRAAGAATATCAWNDAGYFYIDCLDATTITIATRTGGTDYTSELFGGTADQDAVAATWTGDTPAVTPLTIAFDYDDGTDSGTITSPATYAMAAAADAETLAELLNNDDEFQGVTDISKRVVEWYSDDNDIISLRTILGGSGVSLDVGLNQAGFAAMGFDVDPAVAVTGTDSAENSDDTGADDLKSTSLVFQLDSNPYNYEITFASNSLQEAIDDINDLVDASGDVASESTSALTLTSLLEGAASRVYINEATSTADTVLGLSGSADGAGRPNPDFYLDGDGSANIGPNILRNRSSGTPFSLESAKADLYISYEAVREDVTAGAAQPSLLEFDDIATMEAAIGPVSTKNPLALGAFLCLVNAPKVSVAALGVDEKSAASPTGTIDGWARALDYLEAKEVYALAPLTADTYVQGLVSVHVQAISAPAERGERVALLWRPIPDRAADITVASGEDGESNGTDNSFTLDTNPASELIANSIDPSDTIEYADSLYLELVIVNAGASELRRYSVSDANGVILTFRTSFASDENVDGFFTTETFDEDISGADWSLKIRGAELVVTGTTLPDKAKRAAAAASEGAEFAHRRVVLLACDSVDTSVNGITQNVEGYYAAACIAGMTAQQSPQQPFTELPIAGLSRVYGTDNFFKASQLDTIADGGRWILVNQGTAAVTTRHQRTTATTSIEAREYSITKAIDWLAKGLRSTNRVFIGRSVITSGFLDQLTMSNEGFLDYAEQLGVVRKADLDNLLQSTDSPDTVLIEVTVTPAYPCNKIKITIVS